MPPGGTVFEDEHWHVDHAISPPFARADEPWAVDRSAQTDAPAEPAHPEGGTASGAPARGWLIVKPKRHVESVGALSAAEAASLGPPLQRLCAAVEQALAAERVYVCSFGEEVRHVHFHVVPRTGAMPPNGPLLLPELFSEQRPWGCSDDEASQAARAVREVLAP